VDGDTLHATPISLCVRFSSNRNLNISRIFLIAIRNAGMPWLLSIADGEKFAVNLHIIHWWRIGFAWKLRSASHGNRDRLRVETMIGLPWKP